MMDVWKLPSYSLIKKDTTRNKEHHRDFFILNYIIKLTKEVSQIRHEIEQVIKTYTIIHPLPEI